MRPIPEQARTQFGVFTSRQAIRDGWTHAALDRAVAAGRLVRLRRGAFVCPPSGLTSHEASQQRLLHESVAAALRLPDSTVTHLAAAIAHDLPILTGNSAAPCLSLPPGFRIRIPDVHLHRVLIPEWQFSDHAVAISSIARTVLDVSREHGLASGLVIADAAAHRGRLSRLDLERVQASLAARGSAPHNRQLITLLDGRSESPLETVSRLELSTFEPAPEPQVELWSPAGQFLGRADFYWQEWGLVGEADGRSKYADEAVLWQEKLRQDRMTAHGLVLVRWTWADTRATGRLQQIVSRGAHQAALLRAAGVLPRVVHRATSRQVA